MENTTYDVQNEVRKEFTVNDLPAQYRPLGAWAYFGYSLLFSLPFAGFILLLVFSFSDANINRRNFARSYFCALVPLAFLIVIAIIVGVFVFGLFTADSAVAVQQAMPVN